MKRLRYLSEQAETENTHLFDDGRDDKAMDVLTQLGIKQGSKASKDLRSSSTQEERAG